jgi:hypothetical protein
VLAELTYPWQRTWTTVALLGALAIWRLQGLDAPTSTFDVATSFDEPANQAPPVSPTPVIATPAISTSVVAELGDFVIRPVVRGPTGVAPMPPGKPPRIVVCCERPYYFGHTIGGELPDLPPWMPAQINGEAIWAFHAEPDGRAIAMIQTAVILIDRDHRIELGLDLAAFRSTPGPRPTNRNADSPSIPVEEIAASVVIDAHRVGNTVIVLGLDCDHDRGFLAAIDPTTAKSIWSTPTNATGYGEPPNFVVIGGYAILDGTNGPELVVRELGSGHIVSRVPTQSTSYTVDLRPDGTLHGIVRGLMSDGYTSEMNAQIIR